MVRRLGSVVTLVAAVTLALGTVSAIAIERQHSAQRAVLVHLLAYGGVRPPVNNTCPPECG